MRIGVFSKFEMVGGSERRCVELANALSRRTKVSAYLFSEGKVPDRLRRLVAPEVVLFEKVFVESEGVPQALSAVETLLVVNTDSKDFCRRDYWAGLSARHNHSVDLSGIGQMIFLFNFIVSPARHLWEFEEAGPSMKIITANRKFLDEIGEQDRYRRVRHIPRIMLESPISAAAVPATKQESEFVRLGMHSTSNGDKWNELWPELIRQVNAACGEDRVRWHFMGMPGHMREKVSRHGNVDAAPEHSQPVCEFLKNLDIFVFFTSWKREEAWSRSVGEALMSGCPALATPRGGNRDQIVNGNNGFFCRDLASFVAAACGLVGDGKLRRTMSNNARAMSRHFETEAVVDRFLDFVTH